MVQWSKSHKSVSLQLVCFMNDNTPMMMMIFKVLFCCLLQTAEENCKFIKKTERDVEVGSTHVTEYESRGMYCFGCSVEENLFVNIFILKTTTFKNKRCFGND
jgi:hypothetical protein